MPLVYIRISPETLSLRDVSSQRQFTAPALVAISREEKRRVIAVGDAARTAAAMQSADLVSPFAHPRSIVSDYTVAEMLLKEFMKRLFDGRLFRASPVIVMHPKVDPEGGFTQIEIRALGELAIGAGASKAFVWHGRDLADDELRDLSRATGGRILE